MGELAGRLGRINVTSRSPGRAVVVWLTPEGALEARIEPGGADGHTEKSFATEVEAAVSGALRGYGEASRRVFTDLHGGTKRPPADRGTVATAGRLAAVRVTGASPQNLVIVSRTGSGEVSVRICPGTLRRLRDGQLETHVNTALHVASQQLCQALTRALAGANR